MQRITAVPKSDLLCGGYCRFSRIKRLKFYISAMFFCSRNARAPFVEKTQKKIIRKKIIKIEFVFKPDQTKLLREPL